MKAVIIHKPQKLGNLVLSDIPKPQIQTHQILVEVKAIGVNYADLLSVQGLYNWNPKPPYILGLESSGVVVEVGADVTKFELGDRVVIGSKGGNYAEYIAANEDDVLLAPADMDFAELTTLCGNWLTAWVALFELARVKSADTVLINSAAGGVGLAAIALAKSYGCSVYGTVGAETKFAVVSAAGAEPLIYEDILQKFATQKAQFILESVGGQVYKDSLKVLAPLGRMVSIGASAIKVDRWNLFSWIKAYLDFPKISRDDLASQGFMTLHVGHLLEQSREVIEPCWYRMLEYMQENNLHPQVRPDHVFPLSQVNAAHVMMNERRNTGKIVLVPDRLFLP